MSPGTPGGSATENGEGGRWRPASSLPVSSARCVFCDAMPTAGLPMPERLPIWCRGRPKVMEDTMKWVKPTIEEICVGLEINDYFPAEL
ncbi:MAG: pyrroloquinoline quinone precursor peptide PqqA [Parvibaculaceae bacterium]